MLTELEAHRTLYRPGTIIDVGAHIGAFAVPLARLPDVSVLAFEPIPHIAQRLRDRLIRELGSTAVNTAVFSVALSDLPGRKKLSIPTLDGNPVLEWASIAKDFERIREDDPARLGSPITYDVEVWTLDSLDLDDVKSIKLDAEGNEYAILRGSRNTIARCRPFITVELEERHAAGCTWTVPAFLDALRYDAYFTWEDSIYPITALRRDMMHRASRSPSCREYSDPYVFEYYFLPRENAEMRRRFVEMAPGGLRIDVDPSRLSGRMISR